MRTNNLILALALVLFLATAGVAWANDGVERARGVVSGGASDSTSGDVALRATLGQPVVAIVSNAGGDITLGQGFWHGGITPATNYKVYLPVVLRNH
jgi:hypothetical protein